MPIEQSALAAIRSELGQVLWDAPLYQGIFNVQLARAPTRVRFGFQTFWPCYARVEVYRMVTGELDLDMEKENLLRVGYELFGSPKVSHNVLITELGQEQRFWYRISVPRKTPDFPDAKGFVRSRGEFFTPRRNTIVTVDRIHVMDDSDTSGEGELTFSLGLYNASDPRERLVEPRISPKQGVSSGDDYNRPFGAGGQSIGRAPDFIGVYVFGVDDDATFWGAPWYGLGIVGMRPPATMPDRTFTESRDYADMTDALHVFATGAKPGRQEGRFDFSSVEGRLHFSVHGRFVTEVVDTLGERITPPWKAFFKTSMAIGTGGKPAGLVGLPAGAIGVALDPEGRLQLGEGGSLDRWRAAEGPAFQALVAKATRAGALVLVGRDGDGVAHVARLLEPHRDMPCWTAIGRTTDGPPALLEDENGTLQVVVRDGRGRPWLVRLDRSARVPDAPVRLHREPVGRPVVGFDAERRVVLAASLADGRLLVLPLDGDGRPGDAELCEGRFAEALAIMADETAVPLLVAIDREEQILIRPLAERGSAFERLGSLEDVLEGLPGEPPRGRPRVAA
ncbi:MAG: hypothetical protein KDG49_12140 [Geminicoccaceae bacterium]|jgi:hypothetical protein|nr:hypothetical protein [Geminicoccaceae bacterium]